MRDGTGDGSILGADPSGKGEELPDSDHLCRCRLELMQHGEMFVWSHPFDFHFKVNELSGWYALC